jgi:hypothetical protein
MKIHYNYLIFFFLCIFIIIMAVGFLFSGSSAEPKEYIEVDRVAAIKPDYSGVTIPANIAPLNFTVAEEGSRYFVRIYSSKGTAISVSSRNGKIRVPLKSWKSLLEANRGEKLFYDIYIKKDRWTRFQRIENIIAKEDIDSHIAYRLIGPVYAIWGEMGIYQRNLENYKQSVIMHSKTFGGGCMNCHTFLNNSTGSMFIGTRSKKYGSATLHISGDRIEKVGTVFGYTAWHPSGKLAAYSAYRVKQFFHTSRMETRDVADIDSAILYYKIDSQTVETPSELSERDRLEADPAWTPDGKYLYFCSAPILWKDRNKVPPESYEQVKYDLRRVSYNVETDQWGLPETVLSADKTGLSILLPRISPDGRFLIFCMCEYSCFAPFQPSSDLYLMDLQTGDYRKLDINSEHSESWHSWSANSRWIAFSSKRDNGLFTRVYLSYIDEDGRAYKPFIIPQKDPAFYDSCPKLFNVPELISEPVRVNNKALCRIACSEQSIPVNIPMTSATPVAGADESPAWQQERE